MTQTSTDHPTGVAHNLLEQLGTAATSLSSTSGTSEKISLLLATAANICRARETLLVKASPVAGDPHIVSGEAHPDVHLLECCRLAITSNLPVCETGSVSALAFPLINRDQIFGAMGILAESEVMQSDEEYSALQVIAAWMAQVLSGARAEELLFETVLSRQNFLSVVVHELRIPLTAIKGYADLLRQGVVGPINETQRNFVDVIRNNTDRMAALLSSLSDLNRMESGRMKLEPAWISVEEQIRQYLRAQTLKQSEMRQEIQLDIQPDLPNIYTDPQRLTQIIGELLNNAGKYSPANSAIRLSVRMEAGDEKVVRLEVKDRGVGISQEDAGKVFTPFFRSDDPNVREQAGWGLALAVAQRLAVQMGGRLEFTSTTGVGSTFWLVLPVDELAL